MKIPRPHLVIDILKYMAGDMALTEKPNYWKLYQTTKDVYLAPSVNLVHTTLDKRQPILHYSVDERGALTHFLGAMENEDSYYRSMCTLYGGSIGVTLAGIMSCTVTFWNLNTHQSLHSYQLDPQYKIPLWISTSGNALFINNCLPTKQYYNIDLNI